MNKSEKEKYNEIYQYIKIAKTISRKLLSIEMNIDLVDRENILFI
jgi:hypothetical protein